MIANPPRASVGVSALPMEYLSEKIKKFPDTPGVYFFLGAKKKILYIGKATSLRGRVRSYVDGRILETRGPLIAEMLKRAKAITFQKTDSVLEALILEAHLIKKHQPPFNTDEKDDKSFNYVVLTKEAFPRVLVVRGKDLAEKSAAKSYKPKATYGPFPQGTSLREAMKLVRKMFPFRDACIPAPQHSVLKKNIKHRVFNKPCFNAQIGLCPGVCAGTVTGEDYAKTIRNIKFFFEGKKKVLVRELKRDMRAYAKRQEFEKAAAARRTMFALNHIQDVALLKRDIASARGLAAGYRIEAYDVAHISGTGTVGVFTVVEDGRAKKSEYRMFRIRKAPKGSDTDALKEMLERRLGHEEWLLPKLIVTDGGVAQKNAAEAVLREAGVGISVVSVVKDERHRPREILGGGSVKHERELDILLANSEAHRFAIAYHRRIRGG